MHARDFDASPATLANLVFGEEGFKHALQTAACSRRNKCRKIDSLTRKIPEELSRFGRDWVKIFETSSITEFISEKRGLKMMSTPKYHCELTGEGIEYAWGLMVH